MKKVEATTSY